LEYPEYTVKGLLYSVFIYSLFIMSSCTSTKSISRQVYNCEVNIQCACFTAACQWSVMETCVGLTQKLPVDSLQGSYH